MRGAESAAAVDFANKPLATLRIRGGSSGKKYMNSKKKGTAIQLGNGPFIDETAHRAREINVERYQEHHSDKGLIDPKRPRRFYSREDALC
jgi:hypothetical protein